MTRQDSVTIRLDPGDKVLVTRHDSGSFGLHNTGYCLEMSEKQALDLMDKLKEELGVNHD